MQSVTDMEVVAEYQDDFTGSRIDRPQLQALLNQAQSRVIDAVIVYESSRWGRDVRVLLELRDILVNAGVELHYNSRGKVDLITPLGIYMYTNEASFNQLWKAMIIEATSRGKNHKAEGNKDTPGRLVMNGRAPFGYVRIGKGDDATLAINADEAEAVRSIFHWYVYGNGNGQPLSLRGIGEKLEENGLTPKSYRSEWAPFWFAPSIRFILMNEIYTGIAHYGKVRMINGKRVKQNRQEWIKIEAASIGNHRPGDL